MNSNTFLLISRFVIIAFFPFLILGCASLDTTKPNLPYSGNSYPTVLSELEQTIPLLVQELGRLPELQDELTEKDLSALKQIVALYMNDPANFESVFNERYNVGLIY